MITSKHPVSVHVIALDLTETGAVDALVAEMAGRSLVPVIVINNAGFGLAGPSVELSRDEQLQMIDLNVRVLTDLTLRFLPPWWPENPRGYQCGLHRRVYARTHDGSLFCTKNYVLSFSDALSSELRGTGVTMTTLCPGTVKTAFQARAGQNERGSTLSAFDVASQGWAGFKAKRRLLFPGSSIRSSPMACASHHGAYRCRSLSRSWAGAGDVNGSHGRFEK